MGSSDNIQDILGSRSAKDVPLIPLKDTVVFPRIAVPIVVRRDKSVKALEEAMRNNRVIVFVAQKDQDANDPGPEGLYRVGVVAKIREMMKQKDKTVRLVVEGVARAKLRNVFLADGYYHAAVEPMPEPSVKKTERIEAEMYSALNQFRRVVNMGANVPFDVLLVIMNVTDPWMFGDLVAANLELKVDEKQEVLEAPDIDAKLGAVGRALGRQIKLLQMASKIQQETGKELDKMQREVFLREQMKSIEKELETLGGKTESDDLKEKLDKAGLPAAAKEKAMKEYDRLKGMPSFSPEISYLRTYLEWIADLPWDKKDASEIDIAQAKKILDQDHFGLAKAKERILEYLAVGKLVGRIRGPILCFVGPPGTGKTSIGKSIARALGRKFVRVSLGGIRDEAEIRGHRRTYVGALPGRIIQGVATAKTRNPVFMLDEIDKVGADFRGDPSAALLEALDPEQNNAFSDHYLELPFDLSDVMFITTANMLDTIPPALRDRMEVIEFAGYTDEEKVQIAVQHLIPKALKDNGLASAQCGFSEAAIKRVIRAYTREAGVRNLERELSAVCRKTARLVAEKKKGKKTVVPADLDAFLGPARFTDGMKEEKDEVGVVTGLAWTEAGGEILQIEATRMKGRGNLMLTGHLGEVMQESAKAAYSYARGAAEALGVKGDFYKDEDIHVHVPSGAIPKDGPSAGVSMATALVSTLTGRKVRRDIAMTGEITLRGRVLEIGGVKEKVLAAYRAGIPTIILPKDNAKDLVDVPPEIRKKLKFVFAKDITDVLALALRPSPRAAAPSPRAKRR
ncbi:MAG TPA: endopeptidase La [Candidatus Binatia bacterium]|nr:endopeptidase La [Candidatus Binatia bacterium]